MTDEERNNSVKRTCYYEAESSKANIDYLLPEWVSTLKKYFDKKYSNKYSSQNDHDK